MRLIFSNLFFIFHTEKKKKGQWRCSLIWATTLPLHEPCDWNHWMILDWIPWLPWNNPHLNDESRGHHSSIQAIGVCKRGMKIGRYVRLIQLRDLKFNFLDWRPMWAPYGTLPDLNHLTKVTNYGENINWGDKWYVLATSCTKMSENNSNKVYLCCMSKVSLIKIDIVVFTQILLIP